MRDRAAKSIARACSVALGVLSSLRDHDTRSNVQAVYSVSEITEMLGMTRYSCLRYLRTAGVELDKSTPGKYRVWLDDLRERCAGLLDSVTLARGMRALEGIGVVS